ncbi:MAG: DUF192 domain-containing protein [Acidobacteria bacterium]|nr:DUF192 domain-containing protein [Acidobacteriota bacterium]
MSRRIEWTMIAAAVAVVACMGAETAMTEHGGVTRDQSSSASAESRPHLLTSSGERVELEIARSDAQRARGLMFRESLPPAHGMLFVFSESDRHGFWMKNTFIPLDMVWIEADGTIAEIQREIQPCHADPCPSYAPESPGLYVLELAAGEADRLGLREGDRLELRNIAGPAGG